MKTMSKYLYRDKVYGCWLGKNIGGTLGAPFEATRSAVDVSYYTTALEKGSIPNDDLDLQLCWLNAAERYGKAVNAGILAEYWVSAITPNWAEYGVAKTNLRFGFAPPLSGGFRNAFRNSNGAWIRSEIWACLMPGHPEMAVKYAYEDACVDHADEGVYAEVFTAALESAAFAECNYRVLTDIALSYIPEDCCVAKAVKLVIKAREDGLSWKQARIKLLTEIPDSFGAQLRAPNPDGLPAGEWGFDAPSNIGLAMLAWFYGDGDFEKSICIAAGCGEDGDCTTATIGALMGIILGASKLPAKWTEPLGDEIKTCSLNRLCSLITIPENLTELTKRTERLMPAFMTGYFDMFEEGNEITLNDTSLYDKPRMQYTIKGYDFKAQYPDSYMTFRVQNAVLNADLTALDGIEFSAGKQLRFRFHAENVSGFVGSQMWLEMKWLLPEGWCTEETNPKALFLNQYHCGEGNADCEMTLICANASSARLTPVLEITVHDRPGKLYIPVELVSE